MVFSFRIIVNNYNFAAAGIKSCLLQSDGQRQSGQQQHDKFCQALHLEDTKILLALNRIWNNAGQQYLKYILDNKSSHSQSGRGWN